MWYCLKYSQSVSFARIFSSFIATVMLTENAKKSCRASILLVWPLVCRRSFVVAFLFFLTTK